MVYSYVFGFLAGLCTDECVNKTEDYFFKPVVFLKVFYAIAGIFSLKLIHDNLVQMWPIISRFVKYILRNIFKIF